MARLASITGDFGTNITHIAVYRGQLERSLVLLGINSLNTDELERRIVEAGFTLKYRMQTS